jgi:hypothetical protein
VEQAEIIDKHRFGEGFNRMGKLAVHGSMIMMEWMRHNTWYDSDWALRFLLS